LEALGQRLSDGRLVLNHQDPSFHELMVPLGSSVFWRLVFPSPGLVP
jgi:hypothetical protein